MDDPARRTSDECTFGDRPDRRDLTIDPLNPCMSLGAMYAAFGIHRAMPLSHGASGCARFQRMEIARHFQRVLHVPSTMLDDRAAMYGGEDDVREAVANVFRLYDPETIVLFTTCLSETIGDDMQGIVDRLDVPEGKRAAWVSTPSYTGSHLAGYGACVAAMIGQLARPLAPGSAAIAARCPSCAIGCMAFAVRGAFPMFGNVVRSGRCRQRRREYVRAAWRQGALGARVVRSGGRRSHRGAGRSVLRRYDHVA